VGSDSAELPKELQPWDLTVDDCHAPIQRTWKMVLAVMTAMFVVKGSRLALAPRTPVALESAPKFETVPPLREKLQREM
jgi:hypothetical protein